jgi:hypothetical protein
MWDILVFPTNEIQHCDHDFDVCRSCTAKYIHSTLNNGGADACQSISCPQCERQLSYQEILQLADAETVARYDSKILPQLSLYNRCQVREIPIAELAGERSKLPRVSQWLMRERPAVPN